jgi:hypothetical protein
MKVLERQGGEEWLPPLKRVADVTDPSAPPVIDSSKLTAEERNQLREMLMRVAEGGEGEPVGEDE